MTMTDDKFGIQGAITASQHAYAPYSHYAVGAWLVTPEGKTFSGCNVENASYPAGICAERTALVKAISEGERAFSTIYIATANGGSPCGVCRQMLFEFSPHLRVVCVDFEGTVHIDQPLHALLLHGFRPEDLPNQA